MTTLRFAANIGTLFTEYPLEARFAAAAAAGFTAVEHGDPYALPAARYRRLLDGAGLHQVLINSPVGPPDSPGAMGWGCLPDRVDAFRASVDRALEYAVALDCPLVHLRSGVAPSSRDEGLVRFMANACWAAERAARAEVRLTVEAINPHDAAGYLVDTQELAAAVVAAVGPEHIGLQFDIYHCHMGQGDITTRLRALHELVAHVQIADAPNRSEPGTGEIRFEHLFDLLTNLGYAGWVGCEYYPSTTTERSLSWRDALSVLSGRPAGRVGPPSQLLSTRPPTSGPGR